MSGSSSTSAPPTAVKEVQLVLGAAQDVTVYATDSASTKSLDGAQEIGSATNANGTVVIKATGELRPAQQDHRPRHQGGARRGREPLPRADQ